MRNECITSISKTGSTQTMIQKNSQFNTPVIATALFEKKLGGAGSGVVTEVETGATSKLPPNRSSRPPKLFCAAGGSCACAGGAGGAEVESGNKDRFPDSGKKFSVG